VIVANRAADAELKRVPSFEDCPDCKHHLSGMCQGGCMTYKVYADRSGRQPGQSDLIQIILPYPTVATTNREATGALGSADGSPEKGYGR
jgi:hypothetical protein